MENSKKVQLNILIPEDQRNLLRKMAATQMLNDPSKTCSASGIGSQIISEYLNRLEAEKNKQTENHKQNIGEK